MFSGSHFDELSNGYACAHKYLALKTHFTDDGRLKYWRKQARQNRLPPVLLYEISALDYRCVILDGHLRFQAALLEQCLPPMIVIHSATSHVHCLLSEQTQKGVLQQYEKHQQMPNITPQALHAISEHIVRAFDDRPFLNDLTRAAADIPPSKWLNEMMNFAKQQHFFAQWSNYWHNEALSSKQAIFRQPETPFSP